MKILNLTTMFAAPLLLVSLTTQAFTTIDAPVPLDQQIALADILVLAELQPVVAEHEVTLDISGLENPTRLFVDMPMKVIEIFKFSENEMIKDFVEQKEPILRLHRSEKQALNDGLAFPAETGRQVIVSLQSDRLVKDAPSAYVISQQSYHFLEGDTVLVLHDGKAIDKLSLDDFEQLLAKDRERIEKQAELTEPAEVSENAKELEILEHAKE